MFNDTCFLVIDDLMYNTFIFAKLSIFTGVCLYSWIYAFIMHLYCLGAFLSKQYHLLWF